MDVLWQLQGEPTHATRERYRADRERLVRQPMIALLNEVADTDPRYEDFSVWHYRTDSWWWQHQAAVIRLGRKIELGLRFSLDGLRIQGAWWYPDPGQVDMFRKAVARGLSTCPCRTAGWWRSVNISMPLSISLIGSSRMRANTLDTAR
ncbi:hypothetical protein SAMN02745898_11723 [Streptomyces sp. 136MFCol5.1]|nr:hypothetical protein SAMN02745898_11723 [Streptomyces sp. 136MFCol5.1]